MLNCSCQNNDKLNLSLVTGFYKFIDNQFYINNVLFEVKERTLSLDSRYYLRVHLSSNKFYDISLIPTHDNKYVGIINNFISEAEDSFLIHLWFIAGEVSLEIFRLDYINTLNTNNLLGVKSCLK